jgi:hypothetical protein
LVDIVSNGSGELFFFNNNYIIIDSGMKFNLIKSGNVAGV